MSGDLLGPLQESFDRAKRDRLIRDAAADAARLSAKVAEAERDEARAERDRLRATVARVEALVDEWEATGSLLISSRSKPPPGRT